MNRMKILLSAVLVFAATASIAQDFSDVGDLESLARFL